MYFAVKTCSKYHKDRIPVVKHTWAKYTLHIGFYSESKGNVYMYSNILVA
jgi:UDP-glucose:O-linked fucose beta-1,3-glucosyltransferase